MVDQKQLLVKVRDVGNIEEKIRIPAKEAKTKINTLPLLRKNHFFLLDLQVRICHLPGLHDGKFLGNVLQRDYLGLPGL